MQWERVNRPTILAVGDGELSEHLRLFDDVDLLNIARRQARAAAYDIEDHAETALITQQIRVTFSYPQPLMDNVTSSKAWRIPIGPIWDDALIDAHVVSSNGQLAELTPEQVKLSGFTRPVLNLSDDGNLPSLLLNCHARLVLNYHAGYGSDHTDVPFDLRLAVMDQASLLFDAGYDLRRGHTGLSPHTARIAARYRGVRI